ncbi:MAG TPA: c-type cytochrome [Candidatus Solibacter sp.]|nr:c-type cytochrome [Candidatus Solibacter sp.]
MPLPRIPSRGWLWLVAGLTFFAASALHGCSRNNLDYGPAFASAETRGSVVYERNCSPCHDAENLQLLKPPPKLLGLFQKNTLPSGAPATDAQVRKTILEGRGIMPPFEHALDRKQLDDLLRYLHSR